ncbi:MAG: tetratricopeptide repeat protein, partial [Spirochaetota bacterium]
ISSLPDKDASYPGNFDYSSEYFFQNDSLAESELTAWEAVAYENGNVFFERSSNRLRYRKMFCWGRHAGGRRWKDFLSQPGAGDYLEIQAGMAPTQLHGLQMPPHSEWDFVQCFGGCQVSAEASQAFCGEWEAGRRQMKQLVDEYIPENELHKIYGLYRQLGTQQIEKLLVCADGWGALELRRRELHCEEAAPAGMEFPANSLTLEQEDWLHLLEWGYLPEPVKNHDTFSWLVSAPWLDLLRQSLASGKPEADHWYSRLQFGVMLYEQGQYQQALEQWQQSLAWRENPLAYRNLGYHDWRAGNWDKALEWYQKIFSLNLFSFDCAYAEEYLELLLQLHCYQEVWDFYRAYEQVDVSPRFRVLVGRAAVELEQLDFVEQVLEAGYPQLKEGENWLTDIWYIAKAKELVRKQGLEDDSLLRDRVSRDYTPPANLDFRMQ